MRRSVVLGLVLIVALAGCGGDDDDTTTPSAAATEDAVVVVAEDITFPQDSYEATAGTVDLLYRNEGSIYHTLAIEGVDGFKLKVSNNGDEDDGSVELTAGTYTIYCDVPGHRQAGMEAELVVK